MTIKEKPTPKKAAKPARLPQSFAEAAADFEQSKILEIKRSRKIAWIIAMVSTAICSVSILAFLVALLTRTEPEPTILQVDKSTGATTVLRSVRDTKDQYDEVVNKYWLARYVSTCEGYDWFTISEQFEACKLMSDGDVAKEYSRKVQAPGAPLSVLKDKGKVVVKITSIAFFGETAQVRFTSEKLSASGENVDNSPLQKWIATIAFQFKPGMMTEQQRLVNPLGFKAATYRVDPEVIK
ncbi:MAG: type IV secretion system protein [Aquabacterium sp.]|nr:type IV secretion system protein [Aquabacterium sp.]